MDTSDLARKGFVKVNSGPGGEAWVRLKVTPTWVVGQCVIVTPGLAFQIGAAACMAQAKLEALGAAADIVQASPPVVSGKLFKKLGKKFRQRINKAATKIAKMGVLNKLRHAYVKVIQGPIGDLGIAAGARALSAFGVPAAATRVALTQRRNAQADRLRHGGWAGMVATATEDGGAKKLAKQIFERNKQAAIDALPAALPGGGLASSLGKMAGGIAKGGGLAGIQTGYDPGALRDLYVLGCHA